MIPASEFKRGTCILFQGEPMSVVDVQFTTPTARGGNPLAKVKLRHLKTGKLLSESVKVSEKFSEVDLEQRACTYLYADGEHYHFMDSESFDQFAFSSEDLGDAVGYLKEDIEGIKAMMIDGEVVGVNLPQSVVLKVVETDPVIKGATAQAQMKAAKLETGITIQVPPYLTEGELVRVDTRDGHFVERVKG